jgi:arylmalonate decarboxylase
MGRPCNGARALAISLPFVAGLEPAIHLDARVESAGMTKRTGATDMALADKPASWRARIGVIVPKSNTTNEIEFNRMKPEGVTVHFTRFALHTDPAADGFKSLLADTREGCEELKLCNVSTIAFGCTAASMACPPEKLIPAMQAVTPVPCTSTAQAINDALNVVGATKIAVATPYTDRMNQGIKAFLERSGFEVLAIKGLGLGETPETAGKLSQVAPRDVYAHAKSVDRADAQAVLICCTDFGSLDTIAPLEAELGKPVISSNTATFRAALRGLGIADRLEGFGRLLTKH